MNLDEEDEILDAIRKRRVENQIRTDAIAHLRSRAERNVPGAVFCFIAAFMVWLTQFLIGRAISEAGDWSPSAGTEMISALLPIMFVWYGYRNLVPHPCDRLLLLLAKEAVLKGEEPVSARPKDSEGQSSA